jgi:glycosyltransferase involved in cell wall biosynthesis
MPDPHEQRMGMLNGDLRPAAAPMVSVVVPTYQHASFIGDCISGILMQQTAFPVEILIGEDESTDGTREICQRLAAEHPDRIRLFLRSRKDVLHIMGRATGRANLLHLLGEAKGRYIALCEGDDHWTDPRKLQKQVDFLEANPDHVLCFHQAMVLENGILVEDRITEPRYAKVKDRPIGILDLLRIGNFIHTPTVLFRNCIGPFPEELLYSPIGDFFLYVILLQQGSAHRIEEKMAVYRKGTGIFSSLGAAAMLRSTLMTNSCILSYLSDPDQRSTLLRRHLEQLGQYEKAVRHSVLTPSSIAGQLDIRGTFRILFRKLMDKLIPVQRPGAKPGS